MLQEPVCVTGACVCYRNLCVLQEAVCVTGTCVYYRKLCVLQEPVCVTGSCMCYRNLCVLQEYYDYAMRVMRYEFQSLTRIHDFNTGQCPTSPVSTTLTKVRYSFCFACVI